MEIFFWLRYCTLPSDCDASIEPLMRFKWVLLLELLIGADWDGCRSHTQNTYTSLIFRRGVGGFRRGAVMSKRRRRSKLRKEKREKERENERGKGKCRKRKRESIGEWVGKAADEGQFLWAKALTILPRELQAAGCLWHQMRLMHLFISEDPVLENASLSFCYLSRAIQ